MGKVRIKIESHTKRFLNRYKKQNKLKNYNDAVVKIIKDYEKDRLISNSSSN